MAEKKITDKEEVATFVEESSEMPDLSKLMEELAELRKQVAEVATKNATAIATNNTGMDSEVEKHLNESVPFYAFKDNDKYKDDIVVGINGKNWQIKRGIQMLIPRFVYNAIMDSERQKLEASNTSQGFIDKFANEINARKMD